MATNRSSVALTVRGHVRIGPKDREQQQCVVIAQDSKSHYIPCLSPSKDQSRDETGRVSLRQIASPQQRCEQHSIFPLATLEGDSLDKISDDIPIMREGIVCTMYVINAS